MIIKFNVTSRQVQRFWQPCVKLGSGALNSTWSPQSLSLHPTACDCAAGLMKLSLLVLHRQKQTVKNKSRISTKYQSNGRFSKMNWKQMGVMFGGMRNSCKLLHLDVKTAVLFNERLYKHKKKNQNPHTSDILWQFNHFVHWILHLFLNIPRFLSLLLSPPDLASLPPCTSFSFSL